jgi:large subunit ribosomal protein L15
LGWARSEGCRAQGLAAAAGQIRVVSHLVEVTVAEKARKETPSERSQEIGLHNLKPKPGSQRPRKRIGRGEGSGSGRLPDAATRARGALGPLSARPATRAGQNPIHMRMRKLRGPHKKQSMPFENFRTATQPVNIGDLEERFDAGAEVNPRRSRRRAWRSARAGQDPRPRRDLEEARRPRARLQRGSPREIEAAGGSCHTLEP